MTLSTLSRPSKKGEESPYDAVSTPASYLDTYKTTTEHTETYQPTPTNPPRAKPRGRSSRPASVSGYINEHDKTRREVVEILTLTPGLEAQNVRERMARCSTRFAVEMCDAGDVQSYRPEYSCNHRFCVWCASKRSRSFQGKYTSALIGLAKAHPHLTPTLLTLTQTHREGESIKLAKKRLYASFKKLQRRTIWQKHVEAGGIASYEFTISDTDGLWHMHMHSLVLIKGRVDYRKFQEVWLGCTGDSWVVHFAKVDNITDGIKEVIKYIAKPSDVHRWTPDHMTELLELRGERMLVTFGEFREFAKGYKEEEVENDPTSPESGFMSQAGKVCHRPGCGAEVHPIRLTTYQLITACIKPPGSKTSLSVDSVQKE